MSKPFAQGFSRSTARSHDNCRFRAYLSQRLAQYDAHEWVTGAESSRGVSNLSQQRVLVDGADQLPGLTTHLARGGRELGIAFDRHGIGD